MGATPFHVLKRVGDLAPAQTFGNLQSLSLAMWRLIAIWQCGKAQTSTSLSNEIRART